MCVCLEKGVSEINIYLLIEVENVAGNVLLQTGITN